MEGVVAFAYVLCPGATEPSYYKCEIVDNKVVCEIPPITVEGITTIQIKLIETSTDNSKSVLATPEFALEVSKSYATDDGEEMKTTFSGFEEFIMKAEKAYAKRLERIELSSDCMFYAYYADGTTYETDILKKLFLNGNVELSKSFAVGGTGVRTGEDSDNSKYYSNLSKSEALNAKAIMEGSEEILEEVKLHGIYTAFSVDFKTGEVIYASPQYGFEIDKETGHLNAIGKAYSMEDNLVLLVKEWLKGYGVEFPAFKDEVIQNTTVLQNLGLLVDGHSERIASHEASLLEHHHDISELKPLTARLDEIVTDLITGTVLWTNPTPSSEFNAQTIELNLSEYKRIVVETNNNLFSRFVCYEKNKSYSMPGVTGGVIGSRSVEFTDSDVKFGTCSAGMDVNDKVLIPQKIIGYKY